MKRHWKAQKLLIFSTLRIKFAFLSQVIFFSVHWINTHNCFPPWHSECGSWRLQVDQAFWENILFIHYFPRNFFLHWQQPSSGPGELLYRLLGRIKDWESFLANDLILILRRAEESVTGSSPLTLAWSLTGKRIFLTTMYHYHLLSFL